MSPPLPLLSSLKFCAEFRGKPHAPSEPFKACLRVTERKHVIELRRLTDSLGRELGMSIGERGRALLQVTEASTNLLHHAIDGEVFISVVERGSNRAIEMLALDRGPGIADLERALAGGASSRGSLGEGLGAIRRLADDFDLETSPRGTVIFSRTWARSSNPDGTRWSWEEAPRIRDHWRVGALCRAKPGQKSCGDGWVVFRDGRGTRTAVLADGLGHGPEAGKAAEAMVRTVREAAGRSMVRSSPTSLSDLLMRIHEALRPTRGAAVSIARADDARGRLTFVGVGNVEGAVVHSQRRRGLVTHNGTAGSGQLKIQEFEHEWPPGALLVLHSDGIGGDWNLSDYRGLEHRDPSLVAGVLYRDCGLPRDDATVLVLHRREAPREPTSGESP